MGGDRRDALLGERQWLLSRMAETPDLTLRNLRSELVYITVSTLHAWCSWMVQGTALNGAKTNMTRTHDRAPKG